MFLVKTGEGRVFTIFKNRWYSDSLARQWGLGASKRDTRIKRCVDTQGFKFINIST